MPWRSRRRSRSDEGWFVPRKSSGIPQPWQTLFPVMSPPPPRNVAVNGLDRRGDDDDWTTGVVSRALSIGDRGQRITQDAVHCFWLKGRMKCG